MNNARPIKDFAVGIYDGPHATPEPSDVGPIFLGIKNVTEDGRLDFSEIRHVSENEFPKWTRRVKPQRDDIVFSYEATLHRYARIPDGFEGCLGRRMALIRPDVKKVDPRFLHYYLLSPIWRAKMDAITINGATVNRIPLTNFPDTVVSFPGLNEQAAIADILSAYDDLIENNRRRIALLEEAARMLYCEWFVHFRFPGHEHVKIIDGLPEGWEIAEFKNEVDFLEGPGLRNFQYRESGTPFLNIRTIKDDEIDKTKLQYIDESEVAQKYAHFLLDKDDHVVSSSGTLGRVVTIRESHLPVMLNTSLIRMRPKHRIGKWFLKAYLKHGDFVAKVTGMATGAAQLNYGPMQLNRLTMNLPSPSLVALFEEQASDIYAQIKVLLEANTKLNSARDLLLPRLMNGEIAV